MSIPIVYIPRAKETLTLVYNFIYNKFGSNSANKFVLKAEKTIELAFVGVITNKMRVSHCKGKSLQLVGDNTNKGGELDL